MAPNIPGWVLQLALGLLCIPLLFWVLTYDFRGWWKGFKNKGRDAR